MRPSSTRFDLVATVLLALTVGSFFSDLWAHSHGRVETFFTPWHLALYSSAGVVTLFLAASWARAVRGGAPRTAALPGGYGWSLVGALLFLVGGFLDMLWHLAFGIEVNVSALFSPTHIVLFSAGFLMTAGPMRAAWHRGDGERTAWIARLPMVVSAAFVLSVLTAMTQFINPVVDTFAEAPSDQRDVYADVYTMAGDGSRQTRLVSDEAAHHFAPVWSADGSQVAMAFGRDTYGIAIARADGSDLRTLIAPSAASAYPGSWSPDGGRLAVGQSVAGGGSQIVLVDVATGARTTLPAPGSAGHPIFSPDGTRILFYATVDGRTSVWVMSADGSDARRLTTAGRESWGATWSPDGKLIAYNADLGGGHQIYVMDADGSAQRKVTAVEGQAYSPVWSPDGRRIAFVLQRDGGSSIHAVDVDGTHEVDLTRTAALDANSPSWSPTGVLAYQASGRLVPWLVPDIREKLGIAAILMASLLLAGIVVVTLRRGGLPLGGLTIIVGLNTALLSVLNDEYRLLIGALAAGVLSDAVLWRVGRSARWRAHTTVIVAFVAPAAVCAAYMATLALGRGIAWPIHLWAGSVVLAGACGLLLSVFIDEAGAPAVAHSPTTV